jgi:PKD repeat protein
MRKIIFNSLITTSLILASCTRTPKACFILNENKASAKVNEEVKFDASCSTDTKSYTWDFSNGNTEVGVNVKTKYTTSGVYNVTLKATNKSKTNTTVQTITVTN